MPIPCEYHEFVFKFALLKTQNKRTKMKLTIRHTLALLIVFSASFAYAADSAYMATATCRVIADEDKMYSVFYHSAIEDNVTIRIFDEKSAVVYSDMIKSTTGFAKKFDLSNLPSGTYQMEVKSADYLFKEAIRLGDLSGFNFIFTPLQKREIALIGSQLQGKPMTLYILDQDNEVVYKETFSDTREVHKMYDFNSLRSKGVTFVLYSDNQLIKEKRFTF